MALPPWGLGGRKLPSMVYGTYVWRIPEQWAGLHFFPSTLDIKGTLARSEMRRQVPARRRFGSMFIRLGIRVRHLQPRSGRRRYYIYENPEIFSPFLHFL